MGGRRDVPRRDTPCDHGSAGPPQIRTFKSDITIDYDLDMRSAAQDRAWASTYKVPAVVMNASMFGNLGQQQAQQQQWRSADHGTWAQPTSAVSMQSTGTSFFIHQTLKHPFW